MSKYYIIENNCGYKKWEWDIVSEDPKKKLFYGTKLIDYSPNVYVEVKSYVE